MSVLDLVIYPDERLRTMCEPVTDFTDPQLQFFIDNLLESLYAAPGCVGIAAPQVGELFQVFIVHCGLTRTPPPGHHGLVIACNPEILHWSGMEVGREGCLSIPDYTGNVMRATEIAVQYQDRYGIERALTLHQFEARVWQHELDHLEGRLFTDRLVSRRADLFKRKVYQVKSR
ncbi:MAG: peptide deformylase [Magnetococcus sp. DMHC-6]